MRMTVRAHAKINWSLNILAAREDGYHQLDMLMQTLELCDELTFENARWLTLTIDGRALPVGGRNLIIRAANALNDYVGERHGASISLKKRIPLRAGLGGGSADCAAALLALNQLWELRLTLPTLMDIGRTLGADVPFCMMGGLARVGGIGEQLAPLPHPPIVPLTMVRVGDGLSTAQVFQEWDRMDLSNGASASMDALAAALASGDLARAQTLSFNALEAPAIRLLPAIGETMDAFRTLGAKFVRMTGSGSTVYAGFDTPEEARAAADRVPGAFVTQTMGNSPE